MAVTDARSSGGITSMTCFAASTDFHGATSRTRPSSRSLRTVTKRTFFPKLFSSMPRCSIPAVSRRFSPRATARFRIACASSQEIHRIFAAFVSTLTCSSTSRAKISNRSVQREFASPHGIAIVFAPCSRHSQRGTRQCRNVENCPPRRICRCRQTPLLTMIFHTAPLPAHRTGNTFPFGPFDGDIHAFFCNIESNIRNAPGSRKVKKLTVVSGQCGMDSHENVSKLKIQVHPTIRTPNLSHKDPGRTAESTELFTLHHHHHHTTSTPNPRRYRFHF